MLWASFHQYDFKPRAHWNEDDTASVLWLHVCSLSSQEYWRGKLTLNISFFESHWLFFDRRGLLLYTKKDLRPLFTMKSVSMWWILRLGYTLSKYNFNWVFQPCKCFEIGFGTVDEILLSKESDIHEHNLGTRQIFYTGDMVSKVIIRLYQQ